MRAITATKIVPEQIETTTTYECDQCAWTSAEGCWDNEKNAKLHFANSHSFSKKTTAGGITCMWFETLENYRVFHTDSSDDNFCPGDFKEVRWKGPGWYGMEKGVAPGGEFSHEYFIMRSLAWFEKQAQEEIEKQQKIMSELQTLKESK